MGDVNILDVLLSLVVLSAAVGGFRLGFLARGFSWAGLAVGLLAASVTVPLVLRLAPDVDAPLRLLIAVATLFVTAGITASLGESVGLRLRRAVARTPLFSLDRAAGFLAGAAGVLVLVWLVAPAAAEVPGLVAQQVRTSAIVEWVRAVGPEPPDAVRALRRLVDQSRFPEVFAELTPAPDTGPPPQDLPLPADITSATAATGNVETRGCGGRYEGSAFAVGPTTMVTNAHVVAGSDEVRVRGADGQVLAAEVVAFDPDRDLAVLDVPDREGPVLRLAPAEVGAGATVIGYPGGQDEPRATRVTIREQREALGRDLYGEDTTQRDLLFLAADLRRGDSGAPVVDDAGNAVGAVFAVSPDRATTAYALSVEEIRAVLDAPRAPGDTGPCVDAA